jgi:hypothetical protein
MKTLFKITEKGHRQGRLFLSEKTEFKNATKSRLSEAKKKIIEKEISSSWC